MSTYISRLRTAIKQQVNAGGKLRTEWLDIYALANSADAELNSLVEAAISHLENPSEATLAALQTQLAGLSGAQAAFDALTGSTEDE